MQKGSLDVGSIPDSDSVAVRIGVPVGVLGVFGLRMIDCFQTFGIEP